MRVTRTWVAILTENTTRGFAASSSMTLVSTVNSNLKQENVAQALSIVQTVASNPKQENVSSLLSMLSVADTNIEMISVSSSLSLVSTVHSNRHNESVSSLIELDQESSYHGNFNLSLSSFLELQQTASEHFGVANLSVQSHLEFVDDENPFLQQQVNLTFPISLEHTLGLTDEVERTYAVSSILVLSQAVTVSQGILVEHVLDLAGDTTGVNGIFGRSVSSPLDIDHGVAFYIEREALLCQYSPFIGTNGDGGATTPPSATPPILGTATLTLTHPFVTPTTTLVLRNPEFGDTHELSFSRINRETRGGTLEVFADPQWPKTQVLNLTIEALTEAETNSFLAFLGVSLGQEIGLLDWYNRQWRGIITTPDANVTDAGNCRKSINFEFEGELV